MQKIKVGIFFGGRSREREVSFAGGRTVYDNLDKTLFEAIPIFVDSYNHFVVLDWEYIYKGTIRDFYPPAEYLTDLPEKVQIYADSLDFSDEQKLEMAQSVGRVIQAGDFKNEFDFVFLALHGSYGEDGSIQGLLDWYDIPYSGSGVFGNSLGINKRLQKQIAPESSIFSMLKCQSVTAEDWFSNDFDRKQLYDSVRTKIDFPFVVKAANQGSSIGVSFVRENNFENFEHKVNRAFFCEKIYSENWNGYSENEKLDFVRNLIDLRSGIGLPVTADNEIIYLPQDLLKKIDKTLESHSDISLFAYERETEVLFEPFLKGREFSCIVIKSDDNQLKALPPTEIIKKQDFYDYRSKYLPGLSRKVTPMDVDESTLDRIRKSCQQLVEYFDFKVYARIDGFLMDNGDVFLNDPNTTSGMMPSSFFFHQASEIGLSPSEFITYIIRTSLAERIRDKGLYHFNHKLLQRLERLISEQMSSQVKKERLAVILGGNSFERHISVESGRNVFEKINSSGEYIVTALFLDYTDRIMRFYELPISVLLKDNADDIRDKVQNFKANPILNKIRNEFSDITSKYVKGKVTFEPKEIALGELPNLFDGVFIALHGRPGEDGTIQKELDKLGIYYNGSGWQSSNITINKFETLKMLRAAGMTVANQFMVYKNEWTENSDSVVSEIEKSIQYPLIAKPHDDGCSAAVIVIKNRETLVNYANVIFRETNDEALDSRKCLGVNPKDEFPKKESFLIETLIEKNGAKHFLEITGGLMTKFDENGGVDYLVFEPSEALAEGGILSLEEKFLAGQGQNITPARFSPNKEEQKEISKQVRKQLLKAAKILNIEGYCRIDAFVRIFDGPKAEVIVIEVNSLPGMTPATCIYHQAAIENLKPFEFIDSILKYGKIKLALKNE